MNFNLTDNPEIFFEDINIPVKLPLPMEIVEYHVRESQNQYTSINRTGVRMPVRKTSENSSGYIWIKYGRRTEALTHHYIAEHIRRNKTTVVRTPHLYLAFTLGPETYIVSEFIDGPMCDESDIPRIATAVKYFISIPSPNSAPGPVGGGLIEHPFFKCDESTIWYETIQELEDHVNGVSRDSL